MSRNEPILRVDAERCTRKGLCEAVCPNGVFEWRDDALVVLYPGRCIQCGHCVAACPNEAFIHTGIKRPFLPRPLVSPVSPDDLQALFSRRRSCRIFSEDPVTDTERAALLAAAARAPTATNSQNVRFVVLEERAHIDRLAEKTATYYLRLARRVENPFIRMLLQLTVGRRLVDNYRFHLPAISDRFRAVVSGEASLFYNAPLVLVAVASGLPPVVAANTNLAVMQMMLKAETMGLGTCYNGYALTALQRDKRIGRAIGIRDGYLPGAVLAVGHPAVTFYKTPPRRTPRVITPTD